MEPLVSIWSAIRSSTEKLDLDLVRAVFVQKRGYWLIGMPEMDIKGSSTPAVSVPISSSNIRLAFKLQTFFDQLDIIN